jgi:hypothetical protein
VTNVLPYVIPAVIAIVFFIALRLHARATGKALSRAEERLAALEMQLKNNPNSELDDIRKIIADKDLKITQLREETRSALDSLAEATRKKFEETEASEKAHRDQIIEKVTTLLKSSIRRPEQKPESPPTVQPVRENSAHEKAKRLARLIVADIVLYNQAAVEEGIRNNTFTEVMAHDIQEARTLYAQRVPEEIRQQTTYLDEAFADLIARKKQELNLA